MAKPEFPVTIQPHDPPLSWTVTSEHDPNKVYMVSLRSDGLDDCTCIDHVCRIRRLRLNGVRNARCKHAIRARNEALTWCLQRFEEYFKSHDTQEIQP